MDPGKTVSIRREHFSSPPSQWYLHSGRASDLGSQGSRRRGRCWFPWRPTASQCKMSRTWEEWRQRHHEGAQKLSFLSSNCPVIVSSLWTITSLRQSKMGCLTVAPQDCAGLAWVHIVWRCAYLELFMLSPGFPRYYEPHWEIHLCTKSGDKLS